MDRRNVRYWPGLAGGSNVVRDGECGRQTQGMLLCGRLGEPYVMVYDSHHPGRLVGRDGVLADRNVYRFAEP